MRGSAMRPADPSRLTWLAPPGGDGDDFRQRRARLERLIAAPRGPEVYTAKRRSIYRLEDPDLGALAVKEIRNRDPFRSLRYDYLQEHPALREFRTGAAFVARGGRTPEPLAAALDRGPLGLARVLIFLRWMADAVTLTEYVEGVEGDPEPVLLDSIAAALVEPARLGLVHGRHSSDNLLVVRRGEGIEILPIDFAYSSLRETGAIYAPGLVADAARVVVRLLVADACSRQAVAHLFDRVAALAWPDVGESARRRADLDRALEREWRRRAGLLAAWLRR